MMRATNAAFSSALALWVGLAFGDPARAQDAVISLPDGHPDTIQEAIDDTAHTPDGAVLVVPAGTWNVSDPITIDRPLTLRGSGRLGTRFQGQGNRNFYIRSDAVRMESMSIHGRPQGNNVRDIGVHIANHRDFVIQDVYFQDFGESAVHVQGDDARGVISHCEFVDTYRPEVGGWGYGVVVYGDGAANWNRTLDLGSENAVFVEDSVFTGNRHAIASNNGSKYVFRHNTVSDNACNCQAVDTHGQEYGGARGSRSFEIYGNVINNGDTWPGIWIRGGDGVIFDNQINQVTHAIFLSNKSNASHEQPIVEDQTTMLYAWDNTHNGSPVGVTVRSGHEHLFEDVAVDGTHYGDMYHHEPMPGYEPYPYPHPLVGGEAPDLPEAPEGEWYSKIDFGEATHPLGEGNTGTQEVRFTLVTYYDRTDGVVGYAGHSTDITGYDSFALSIRANQQGFIDAYHVDGYQAENHVPYTRHLLYDITLVIDLEAGVYDAWVTPPDGTETMIADGYAFRSVAPEMNDLGRVAIRSYNDHDIALIGHTLGGDAPPEPCATQADCPDGLTCESDACVRPAAPDGSDCGPGPCLGADDTSGGGCTATGLGAGNPWLVLLGAASALLLRRRRESQAGGANGDEREPT
jgi:hypothetical protein